MMSLFGRDISRQVMDLCCSAEFPKAAFPVLGKNSAKTKESKQAFVGWPRNVCFCNGPLEVNPFFAPYPLPEACFCTGSALGRRLMVFEEERAGPILETRGGLASVQAPPANIAA